MSAPSEKRIQRDIQLAAPKHGCFLLRNPIGTMQIDGRWITFGMGKGSSDLIGWTKVDGAAIYTAVEVKKPGGRIRPDQPKFLKAVELAGGIAMIARSVDEFAGQLAEQIERIRNGSE